MLVTVAAVGTIAAAALALNIIWLSRDGAAPATPAAPPPAMAPVDGATATHDLCTEIGPLEAESDRIANTWMALGPVGTPARDGSMCVANSVLEHSFSAALRAAESARQARERHYLIHIAGGVPAPRPRDFAETDHCDQLVGSAVYRWELLRRYQVAVATAEYRAGLVAGGVELPSDWLDWLHVELNNLPSMAALEDGPDLDQVRATIEAAHQPGYRVQLEKLPDYWLGQGRADGDRAGLSA